MIHFPLTSISSAVLNLESLAGKPSPPCLVDHDHPIPEDSAAAAVDDVAADESAIRSFSRGAHAASAARQRLARISRGVIVKDLPAIGSLLITEVKGPLAVVPPVL
jgi:hypothetical protein